MKIGINASFLAKPMTGIGQVTTNFLKELVEFPTRLPDRQVSNFQFSHGDSSFKFQDTHFILYCQEEPKFDFELPENFEIRVFLPWWKRDDVIRQWLWERELAREAMQDGCEVFFSLYQSATVFNLQPGAVRHVMLVHDLIPKLFPEYLGKWSNRFHYRAILKAITQATALIAPSETTREDIVRLLGIEDRRITTTPLGVEARFFDRLDETELAETLKRYNLTPGYLYHGGGLEVRKNTEAVLNAYVALCKENGEEKKIPPLVISGRIYAASNPLATPVVSLIETLGLVDQVKLLGLVPGEDLPALYQGAKMFLFPSRYEGFGLPVLEAYASGTPVITTQAGSLRELITQGEALVIENRKESASELQTHMKELLTQPDLAETLRARAQLRARDFSWEQFTQGVMRTLLQ